MRWIKFISGAIVMVLIAQVTNAQNYVAKIYGPFGSTTAIAGQTKTYTVNWTVDGASVVPPAVSDYYWYATNGNVSAESGTSADVQWTSVGTNYVDVELSTWNNYYYDKLYVTVSSLSAPVSATPINITESSFTARWNTTSGATGYRLDVSKDNFATYVGGYQNLYVSGTTSKVVSNLYPGTVYKYRIRAEINGVSSGNSATQTATTLSPSHNYTLSISGTSTPKLGESINYAVYWADFGVSVNAPVVDYYYWGAVNGEVNNSTSSTSAVAWVTSGTGYVDVELETWGNYYYKKLDVTVAPPLAPVPTTATNISYYSFTANWNAVLGASGYQLDVSKDNFVSYVSNYYNLTVSATSKVISGLVAGTTYQFRVRAVSGNFASGNSSVQAVKTLYENNENWIKTNVLLVPQKDLSTVSTLSITEGKRAQNFKYVDGLGRPMQTVSVLASPQQKDIVQPIVYDGYGMETVKYLPYVSGSQGWNDGWFKSDFFPKEHTSYATIVNAQYQFYQNTDKVSADSKPYAETKIEPSPLARVVKQGAPGLEWQPDSNDDYTSTDHTVKTKYLLNTTNEVRLWKYANPSDASTLGIVTGTGTNPYYAAGELYKTLSKDEQGNEVIQYVDKEGRTVLKRVQAISGSNLIVNDVNYASTYYVYDDYGSLVSVIPPKACETLTATLIPFSWGSTPGLSQASDNTLTKTAVTGYTNSGAYLTTALPANTNGWVRMVAGEVTSSRMIGLAPSNAGTNNTIAFALELASDAHVYISEDGTRKTDLGIYQTGTSIMISREGGYVKYYVNDVYKATSGKTTSTTLSTSALYVDATINDNLGTIKDVDISFSTEKSVLNNFGFWYTYDARGRMTQKQVPGASPVYMVYDQRDRLVLTQDGNQRTGATHAIKYWTFTKYDELNRPIMTGIKDTTTLVQLTQSQMQDAVNTYYNLMTTTKPWRKFDETYVGNAAGNIHGYTNKSYPVVTTGATTAFNSYLTVNYYDSYSFKSILSGDYAYVNDGLTETRNTVTYTQPPSESTRVIGSITGSKVRVLDGNISGGYAWLTSVNYYDDKYRTIQSVSDNYKGGSDRVSTLYDFSGKVLKTLTTHYGLNFKDLVSLQHIGNRLNKTITTNVWGDAGAASVEMLPANTDGWVEFIAASTTNALMVGFSEVNADASWGTIKYALYLNNGGKLEVRESGSANLLTTLPTYAVGNVLRIERKLGKINYYKNGSLLLQRTATVNPLLIDVSFYTSASQLYCIRSSFGSYSPKQITRRFDYDHAGRLLKTWHQIGTQTEVLLSYNQYNELGQLIDKKLHSTLADGSNNKQSVDYRYNIRGWLTSMNNAELVQDATNDDTGDYFGMNLAYNIDLGTGNTSSLQYNGNISAMKWSVNQGYGTVKEMAYNYGYDALNRLLSASHKQANTIGTWVPGQYDESGLSYDLNGNIKGLLRNGDGGIQIDNLVYNYGATTTASNKLLYVQDNAPDAIAKLKGFSDGQTGTATDYVYDANGNMTMDKNKGITTAITYNYLNLPTTITKGSNYLFYIYDGTGRKLSQVQTYTGSYIAKETSYAGEFQYENDALQFISHEEGRVVMSNQQLIYSNAAETTTDITASNATLATYTNNGEKYIKVTSGGTIARTGIFPIGGTFSVSGGEIYKIRVKGYRTGTNPVFIQIKANGSDLNWPGAAISSSAVAEAWIEQTVTIPASATTLQVGVNWNVVASGEIFYLNEFEITKLSDGNATPEYQYNLKDHLGNIRVTFTTKQDVDAATATLEAANASAERSKFLRYDNARLVNHYLFDHTNGSSPTTVNGAAQRLSGQSNEVYGLARSLSVMPGDVINMEVYAKYIDSNSANRTPDLNTLISQIATGTATTGTVVDGGGYTTSTSSFPFAVGLNSTGTSTGTGPKAYLNWLIFDRNYNFITGGYQRMSTVARETGQDVAHEKLSGSVTVGQVGYVYVYVSNEEGASAYEVYFDDFKITHSKSPVIQAEDYYPFGLQFNSYTRENSVPNRKKFNGIEEVTDLGLNVYTAFYRVDDPAIGRWWQIDPKPNFSWSSYSSRSNNPVRYSDPLGDTVVIHHKKQSYMYENGKLYQNGQQYTGKVKGFLKQSVNALDKVRTGGAEGQKLVGELQSNAATTNIMKGSNGFTESGDKSGLTNVVRWSPGNTSGGPNESGGTSRPSFIGLGHELAHSYDKVTDGKVNYAPWPGVTGAAKAEMFATHVENMLRAENQIPLRTHYGINNSSGSPVYEGPLVYPGTRASTNPQFNQYVAFLDEWLPYVYQH